MASYLVGWGQLYPGPQDGPQLSVAEPPEDRRLRRGPLCRQPRHHQRRGVPLWPAASSKCKLQLYLGCKKGVSSFHLLAVFPLNFISETYLQPSNNTPPLIYHPGWKWTPGKEQIRQRQPPFTYSMNGRMTPQLLFLSPKFLPFGLA